MTISAFLIISSSGRLRATKTRPYINNDEIALNLNIDVPDSFFERLIPTVDIKIPDAAVMSPDIDTTVEIFAAALTDKLKIDTDTVIDGFKEVVREAVAKGRNIPQKQSPGFGTSGGGTGSDPTRGGGVGSGGNQS